MKNYLYLTVIISLLLTSCFKKDELIYIPDKNDRNLPAYTEVGYNSFGAVYESSYFIVEKDIAPCKIIYQSGMLDFHLIGKLRNYQDMDVTFSFPFPTIDDYTDLAELNNTVIDLSDPLCSVEIKIDNKKEVVTQIHGKLTFKRVQLLKIDGKANRTNLSGFFEVSFLKDGKTETISEGRFDVGINRIFRYLN